MKRNPYRAAFAAMTISLLVACSQGGGAPEPAAGANTAAAAQASLESAMQADRDFAAVSKKDGPKAAFLQYMDKDGAFFQPGAVVNGAEAVAAGFDGSPPDFGIDWTPDGGHGSAGGDLAVTTGRYTISSGGQKIEQGRYVTVWRKDAAGALKAVMDLGVPDPAQSAGSPAPDKPDLEGRPG
ncbi:MAG: nuclear transport factor 2 family protein [Hyphomonadaceae bacterium]|nr:nuclear transport factor 2 family protein [Hyphomonadaceae bacterium]